MSELFEETADFELGLRHARSILDGLSEGEELGPPDFERGLCGECACPAYLRWRHGRNGDREGEQRGEVAFCRLPLCRSCRRRRLEVAARLAEPAPLEAEREPLLVPLSERERRARRLAGATEAAA